ncbi:dihydroorotase, homodimeric type [Cladophialophora bantiana CBS 173.52]|uniref:dihydroorotase n=1 Tax=Cladophialophora bantiana (strain ATCC 10958 / CBS 173.52 / CDC B-1940 / NIH 8579) TaxID=1442370 RepID=A0A0D2HD98_CLAB1|nr:dihydroorotase, homodimeric type [Cladophialophora bantiana CBS 173.52]KIW88860.1 dihydroorotase, homodimeric type [Cladophialophora bantiana CBS 173.52]
MELVVPQILKGGVDTVFVMPNLQPPITGIAQALEYRCRLRSIEPRVHYLMSLYLHPSITPEVIAEAAAAGITGVKMYPQGVTTNSESGVPADFLNAYSPVFAAMEYHDLVLNLHGEWPGPLPSHDISLEEAFLPELKKLHQKFPRLRCVLEHCSTAAALDAVRACGPSVAGTITAHHLYLTGDHSQTDPLAFCKPIPKKPSDRDALIKAVCSGDPKFFFGSDSAPHPLVSKQNRQAVPAGVFTQPFATQLVVLALEEAIERGLLGEDEVTQDRLEQFLSRSGRLFYKLPDPATEGRPKIVLERKGETIPTSIKSADGTVEIGLSKSTAPVFSLSWLM